MLRTALRSLALAFALIATHCLAPAPAFAQDATSAAASAATSSTPTPAATPSVTKTPTPPAPSAPTAPAAAVADTTAIAEQDDTATVDQLVDDWFAKHFHGLGAHLTEYLHGRLLAAVDELKALLHDLPLS